MVSISMDWSKISLLSVVAFLIGWYFFGLFAAVVITLVVLVLMGTLRIKSETTIRSRP